MYRWDFLLKINKLIGGIFGSIQLGIEEAAWYSNRKFFYNWLIFECGLKVASEVVWGQNGP